MTARPETAIRVPANRDSYQLPQRVVRVQIERLEGPAGPLVWPVKTKLMRGMDQCAGPGARSQIKNPLVVTWYAKSRAP